MSSSWDRSRHIPWSRITPPPPVGQEDDPEGDKERVFRALAREAAEEEKASLERKKSTQQVNGDAAAPANASAHGGSAHVDAPPPSSIARKDTLTPVNFLGYKGRPYSTADLLRNVTFGATIGSITGMAFGFMDGMRSAGESDVLKRASNAAKGRYLLQGTTRSGLVFGAFFGTFHAIKYAVRVLVDPGDFSEIGIAGSISMGAMLIKPATRPSLPYAAMLIGMDSFHIYMREGGSQ